LPIPIVGQELFDQLATGLRVLAVGLDMTGEESNASGFMP